ncbi:MAG: T9SS type A sorting domain-containing protein [Candidatus Marinimicrobia bacterium]|nr:T9SS type A sorting domain-containing protein [Candidatus Neomarinimicrobiota bacterium]
MNRLLIIAALVVGSWSQVLADDWTFDRLLIDFEAPQSNATGVHGVVRAPDGNFWLALHGDLATDTIFTAAGDTINVRPVYVLGPDGNHVSFSPIQVMVFADGTLDTLHAGSVHNGSGKGISVDRDGNILYTSWSTVYRINYLTGAAMNRYTPTVMGSMTEAVQDDNGNIYVGYVSKGNPLLILDTDFNFIGNAIDTVKHLSRTLAVTPDGKDLYLGSTWNGIGIPHYHSNLPGVTAYEPVDTLGNWYDVPDTTSTGGDTTVTVMLWASCLDWGNGILWAGNLRPDWSGKKGGMYYGFDVSTGLIIDSLGISMGDSSAGGVYSPRGATWGPDGHTMYLADFDYNIVSVWTNPNPVTLEIEEEGSEPIVARGYKLAQNFPNPFNPTTTIEYLLPINEMVSVAIYNLKGELVKTLVNKYQSSGSHRVVWNGTDSDGNSVASGVYLYRIKSRTVSLTKRMTFVK